MTSASEVIGRLPVRRVGLGLKSFSDGCVSELGIPFLGVLIKRALLFGVHMKAP